MGQQRINLAHTSPANPSSSTTILTPSQIWAGLSLKVSSAQDFVSAITSTTVVSTTTSHSKYPKGLKVVTRDVVFREGNRTVREEVVFYPESKVVFHLEDGSQVQNIISGDGSEERGLFLTFDFEWVVGKDQEVSEEELREKRDANMKMARGAVEGSLKAIREMVADGRISK